MSKIQTFELWNFAAGGVAAQHAADKIITDITANRHKGNPESVQAFRSVKDRLSEQQQRVLKAIRDSDNGLTVDEIATKLGVTPNMVSGRASELKRDGKIRKNGVRLTRSGCNAAVLVIA